jgi:hypothetical protein
MAVAIVETARRLRDAHHRARQHLLRIAHRLGERAAHVKRKIRVAVVGEAAGEPDGLRFLWAGAAFLDRHFYTFDLGGFIAVYIPSTHALQQEIE